MGTPLIPRIIAVALIPCLISCACVSTGHAEHDDNTAPLKFLLTADKKNYRLGEDPEFKLALKNVSGKDITIHNRLLPSYTVKFRITLNGASISPLLIKYDLAAPQKNDYVTLKPGSWFVVRIKASRIFILQQLGTYTVEAEYTNKYKEYWNGTDKRYVQIDSWTGKIMSEPVRFSVG